MFYYLAASGFVNLVRDIWSQDVVVYQIINNRVGGNAPMIAQKMAFLKTSYTFDANGLVCFEVSAHEISLTGGYPEEALP